MKINNEIKYYIQNALFTIVLFLIGGAVLQTFMLEIGIPTKDVFTYISVMQIIQVAVMMLISKKIEMAKNIPGVVSVTQIMSMPLLVLCLVFCIISPADAKIKYFIIFGMGVISNVGLGVQNVVSYKLPYNIFNMERYGKVSGYSGVVGAVTGILFSVVLSYVSKKFVYLDGIVFFFIFGIVALIVAHTINFFYVKNDLVALNPQKKSVNIFKNKYFRILFIPNLLRGFNMGVLNLIVSIGYYLNIINSQSAGYILIITNVSSLLGCFIYSLLSTKHIEKWIILVSSIMMAVLMPLMCVGKNQFVYLTFYAIAYLILNFINIAVPVSLTKIIDYNIMGQFTAWRMLLTTLGVALSGMVCIPMIDALGSTATFLISGAMQAVSGIVYFLSLKKI